MNETRDPQPGSGDPIDDPIDELLGAYVLDALDPDETAEVEQHLTTSPAARTEVDRLTHAIDQVIDSQADAPQPPADLWDRIADQLSPRAERVPADSPQPTSPTSTTPDEPVDELAARRSSRTGRTAAIFLAVAAAIAVVAISVGLVRGTDDSSTTDIAAQLQQQADKVASEPGSQTATLTGADPSVSVRVVIDDQGRGYVVPEGLPALSSDQTYQLWSVDGGTPISLGLLGSDPTVAVVGTGTSPQQLAITAEPAGGSTGPTSDPVAVGTLA